MVSEGKTIVLTPFTITKRSKGCYRQIVEKISTGN
jgi:hypothetical protein